MDDQEKKIDQDWKEKARKEKEELEKEVSEKMKESFSQGSLSSSGETYQKPNFLLYISDLSIQGMIFLGLVENPITKKTEKNLTNARYIIDVLEMLEEKTKGNLDETEQKALGQILYQLRMAFVEQSKEEKSPS